MKTTLNKLKDRFGAKIKKAEKKNSNELHFEALKENLAEIARYVYETLGFFLVTIVCTDERKTSKNYVIHYFFSDDKNNCFLALRINVGEADLSFPSITPHIHEASWYEREIMDMFGLKPENHPDPKRIVAHENWPLKTYPLRKDFAWNQKVPYADEKFNFYRLEGEGVFEIPVGPVHAGIIEPGHFRFSVAGERVLYLEPRLFYKHKGIEKLFETKSVFEGVKIAERVSGDTSFTHSLCFVEAVEKSCGITVPENAKNARVVFSELERIYNHLGDCGFIALDTGYSFGGAQGTRLKEKIMQLNEKLTGSRFLRKVSAIGGVSANISEENKKLIEKEILSLEKDFKEVIDIEMNSDSLLDRLETTGVLENKIARDHNALGVAARASGISRDARIIHPYETYGQIKFDSPVLTKGDVYARFKIRTSEIFASCGIIRQAIERINGSGAWKTGVNSIPAGKSAINVAEGWRGEIAYYIETAAGNRLNRCKVRDASFHNWSALPHAVKNNIVPDFPLINKSFDLSYSGNDL